MDAKDIRKEIARLQRELRELEKKEISEEYARCSINKVNETTYYKVQVKKMSLAGLGYRFQEIIYTNKKSEVIEAMDKQIVSLQALRDRIINEF